MNGALATIALAAAISTFTPLNGASANERATGLGQLACQSAIALADRPDYQERLGQWVVGYLSGLDAGQPPGKKRAIDQVQPKDAGLQAITACRFVDPSDSIASAVRGVYEALPVRR